MNAIRCMAAFCLVSLPGSAWAQRNGADRPGPDDDNGYIYSVSASPTGKLIAVVGRQGRTHNDGRVSLYEVTTGAEVAARLRPGIEMVQPAFDPKGERLAVVDERGQIVFWRIVESGQTNEERLQLLNITALSGAVDQVVFSPRGDLFAAACRDYVVRVDEVATNKQVVELQGHTAAVHSVAFSPDGRYLASAGGTDGTIRIWSTEEWELVRTLERGKAFAVDAVFTSDSRQVVAAYGDSYWPAPPVRMEYPDEQVRVWEVTSGKLLRSLRVGGDRITSMSVSPSGKLIAAGWGQKKAANVNSVVVLDAATGERKCVLPGTGWLPPLADWCGDTRVAVVSGAAVSLWDISNVSEPKRTWTKEWSWKDDIPHTPVARVSTSEPVKH